MQTPKELLDLVDEFLTKQEVLDSYKKIINQVMGVEAKLIDKINTTLKEVKDDNSSRFEALQGDLSDFKAQVDQSIRQSLEEQKNGLNFLVDKAQRIREFRDGLDGRDGMDGRDGKDADEEKIVKSVLDKVDLSELEDTMEELRKEIEELKTRPTGRLGGGGTNYLAIKQHFVDDETPTNTGDDTNFTIAHAPNPTTSLKVYRNGQRLRVTEDFTFSGVTITLLTALTAGEVLLVDYKV